jgi:glycosyltransferase involved in cell wall biosynthesis
MPPPWSGIGVSVGHLLASPALKAQSSWLINSSASGAKLNEAGPKRITARRVSRHLQLARSVVRATRQHRPHVVHLHGSSDDLSFVANWLGVLGARLAGARVLWQLHQDLSVVAFPGRRWITQSAFTQLMRTPNALAVLTDKDRCIAAEFVNSGKVAVLPPASSPEFLDLPIQRSSRDFRVLYVGWLTEAKGIRDLLRTALALRQRGSRISFDVLGTGRTEGEVEAVHRFIERHELRSMVRLHGVVTGSEKARFFARTHALLMPTHKDAFPLAVLEAMAAGMPVVGSNVGGIPYMIERGQGGYLPGVGDISGFAECLQSLSEDPSTRLGMGRANRERFIREFHPASVGRRTVSVYWSLLAGNFDEAASTPNMSCRARHDAPVAVGSASPPQGSPRGGQP